MESRARKFSPLGGIAATTTAGELPHILGMRHGRRNGRTASNSTSVFTWLVRLFVVVLSCGLVLQLWLWRASSTTSMSDAQQQRDNGFAGHLRRFGFQPDDGDADTQTDSKLLTTPRTSVPLTANPMNASAFAARRTQYDPANHNVDQRKVAHMVQWAWKGYETFAFGRDALNVRTMAGDGLPSHDMALTLVDSLDTLYLVGMFREFDRASNWVAAHMDDRIFVLGFISLFETTIRLLGGLLAAYDLSGHAHLLETADKLGNALSPAFESYAHGVPDKDFDIVRQQSRSAPSLAEVGSLQLEFKFLARLTGNERYFDQVERISDSLARDVAEKYTDGLLPVNVHQHDGRVHSGKITLGANGDSYYEYLLKQWLLSGKRDNKYKQRYLTAVDGIMRRLVGTTRTSKLVFIGELVYDTLQPKMDHLVCFVPGMLALGFLHGMPQAHLTLAEQLIETCYQMYAQMDAKLAPEIAYFHMDDDDDSTSTNSRASDLDVHERDAFNLLRPETVESLMILYRVTKNETYRSYGRKIMDAFETHCKLERGGYTSIGNVATGPPTRLYRDEMESFFIAETLKYLFLLFSDDDVLPLDKVVFSTEAHPFPMATTP